MATDRCMNVSIRDGSLRRRVLKEKRSRGDKSLSKTIADLARERLAMQDLEDGLPFRVVDGRVVLHLGQLVDVKA